MFIGVAIAVAVLTVLQGCKKDRLDSAMIVKMTDAPASYLEVNAEIDSVAVHFSGSGWTSLETKQGIYNLLELQNDVMVVLVDSTMVPAGHVTQIRLVLGNDNSIRDTSGVLYPLIIPSGEETGIKLNLNTELQPHMTTEVLLDFDANQSVVHVGSGIYHLKPVIKVESVTQY